MNRIKQLRSKNGVRQVELANILGISQSTLSTWENGRYEPDIEAINRLADYFNVSVDYLLGRDVQPQKNSPAPPEESEADLARKKLYEKLDEWDIDQLEKLLAFIDLLGT